MDRQTQFDRLLGLLQANAGRPVALPAILSLGIASHTRRLFEIRQAGWLVEMKDYYVGHSRHVSYTLLGKLSDQKA